jgi:hypothetical protein
VHVHVKASARDWLDWARENGIHELVLDYIEARPDHLWSQPPKHEEPFSTPRSWHMLSDSLREYGDKLSEDAIEALAFGCLSPPHAGQFKAFVKQVRSRFRLNAILKGELSWPSAPQDRDILYFLSQSFRAHLIKELPESREAMGPAHRDLAHRGKGLLKELASLSFEMAQLVVSKQEGEALPDWFMIEIVRDLPRLVERRHGS